MIAHEILYDESVCQHLDRVCVARTSFEEMTGTPHPWEVMNGAINSVQNQFLQIENDLSANHKDGDLTCVKTAQGAFWINKNGVDSVIDELNHHIGRVSRKGPVPLWNYTSIELFTQILDNLKRLIITTSHDRVELKRIETLLNGTSNSVLQELNKANTALDELLGKIKQHAPHVSLASQPDVVLYERARITFDLLQKHLKTEQQLGYDRATLKQAYDLLESRCGFKIKNFRQRIQAFMLAFRDELRQSEILQLLLSSRWGLTLSSLEKPSESLTGLIRIIRKETDWFSAFVSSRDTELGPSPSAIHALAMAEKADYQFTHGKPSEEELAGRALSDDEIQQLLASDKTESENEVDVADAPSGASKPKKSAHRMAFTSRGRR